MEQLPNQQDQSCPGNSAGDYCKQKHFLGAPERLSGLRLGENFILNKVKVVRHRIIPAFARADALTNTVYILDLLGGKCERIAAAAH
jgi:hypothetical protein